MRLTMVLRTYIVAVTDGCEAISIKVINIYFVFQIIMV